MKLQKKAVHNLSLFVIQTFLLVNKQILGLSKK